MANTLLYSSRARAKKEQISFNLTKNHILELIGNGRCPVFKFKYNLNTTKPIDESPTLDRISCKRGYVKGNCAVISWLANTIKTKATAEQIRLVANWLSKQEKKKWS